MASLTKEKKEALSDLDVTMTVLERLPAFIEADSFPSLKIGSNSPFDFIVDICKSLGIYDKMVEHVSSYLTKMLPSIEIALKGIILSNLKSMISCSYDPRIPVKFRKHILSEYYSTEDYERGVYINMDALDYNHILDTPPMDKLEGQYRYFGVTEIKSVYELARAKDFNAFLWFAIHKSHLPLSNKIEGFEPYKYGKENNAVGQTFSYGSKDGKFSSSIISMCARSNRDDKGNFLNGVILPITDTLSSVNWYSTGKQDFQYLHPNAERVYEDEKPLCNVEFTDSFTTKSDQKNKIRITVLPKPLTIINPQVNSASITSSKLRVMKILFNEKGEVDNNGGFSCRLKVVKEDNKLYPISEFGEKVEEYPLKNEDTFSTELVFTDDEKVKQFEVCDMGGNACGYLVITKDGYKLADLDNDETKNNCIYSLYECFPHLTLFEFNYKMVMGMQLFDPKVLASNLINTTLNGSLIGSLGLELNKTQIQAQQRVVEIVNNIIESDEYEASDCYYAFSNAKYDEMDKLSELRRMNKVPFADSTDKALSVDADSFRNLLSGYSESSSLVDNTEIINHAISDSTASVIKGYDSKYEYSIKVNAITKIIQNFCITIVNTIFTPKIIILFEMNKQFAEENGKPKNNVDDLMKDLNKLMVLIIKGIVGLVLSLLIKDLIRELKPLMTLLSGKILTEQLTLFKEKMKLLLDDFKNCFGSHRHTNVDSKIDDVLYADIVYQGTQAPKTNC